MDNEPNLTPKPDDSQNTDIDARIAAEHHRTGQYVSTEYDESLFDGVTSAIANNKIVMLAVVAVTVILIGSLLGINASRSHKEPSQDTVTLKQNENRPEYDIVTINSDTESDESTVKTKLPKTGDDD